MGFDQDHEPPPEAQPVARRPAFLPGIRLNACDIVERGEDAADDVG